MPTSYLETVWRQDENDRREVSVTGPSNAIVRTARASDAGTLADIHLAALPGDILPRLGKSYLEKHFFPGAMASSDAEVLVVELNGIVHGFHVVAFHSAHFTHQLIGARWAVLTALFSRLPADPGLGFSLVDMLWGTRVDTTIAPQILGESPEIYVIAVRPGFEGKGLGSILVSQGIAHMRQVKPNVPRIVVKTSSEAARSFYEKHGFTSIGLEIRGRRVVHVLIRSF